MFKVFFPFESMYFAVSMCQCYLFCLALRFAIYNSVMAWDVSRCSEIVSGGRLWRPENKTRREVEIQFGRPNLDLLSTRLRRDIEIASSWSRVTL